MQKEHIIGQLKYIILHICRFQCIIESFFSFEGTVSFCPLDEGRLSKINHKETNLKSLQTDILACYTSLNIAMCGYSLLYCLAQHHSNQNVNYMVPPTPVNYVHHCMQFTAPSNQIAERFEFCSLYWFTWLLQLQPDVARTWKIAVATMNAFTMAKWQLSPICACVQEVTPT